MSLRSIIGFFSRALDQDRGGHAASGSSGSRSSLEKAVRSACGGDSRVADALLSVPREEFVPESLKKWSYEDQALLIPKGQTISQPSLVAHMISRLELSKDAEKVLDVGVGSGYQSAVLSQLARRVIAVERIPELAQSAEERLHRLGYNNVEVRVARGDTLGWPEDAPYDGIIVGAGAPDIPSSLCEQLSPGARLVIPVGKSRPQRLAVVVRDGDKFSVSFGVDVVFVPLIGPEAW